jgi:hypothetical protein
VPNSIQLLADRNKHFLFLTHAACDAHAEQEPGDIDAYKAQGDNPGAIQEAWYELIGS